MDADTTSSKLPTVFAICCAVVFSFSRYVALVPSTDFNKGYYTLENNLLQQTWLHIYLDMMRLQPKTWAAICARITHTLGVSTTF